MSFLTRHPSACACARTISVFPFTSLMSNVGGFRQRADQRWEEAPSAHQSKIECAPVQCACVAAPSVLYLLQPIYHSSRIRGRSAENRESVVVPSNVARERDLEKKKEGDNRKKGKRNCLLYGITCRTSGGGEGCRVHPAFTAKSSIHSSVNSLS